MATIQGCNANALFVFVSNFNPHYWKWLNSVSSADSNGRAALDFANFSGCEQIILGSTYISWIFLALVFTDAPSVVNLRVVSPVVSNNHSEIAFGLKTPFLVPDECIFCKIFLRSSANWT